MTITFEIRENGHVVYYQISDPWNIEEYDAILPDEIAFWNAGTHRVHQLMNAAHTHKIPSGVLKARFAPIFTHPRRGQLAIVGSATSVRIFSEAVLRLASYDRAKFFDTEDEAWAYLRAIIHKEQVQNTVKED